MKIYAIRHCQTNYNVLGLLNDVPNNNVYLTHNGKKQAENISNKLKKIKFDAIFCSEFLRTKQTAKIINKNHKAKIIIDSELNEQRMGLNKLHYTFLKVFYKFELYKKVKGMESHHDVIARVKKFIKKLKADKVYCKYNNILIVTHGALFRAIWGISKNLKEKDIVKLGMPFEKIVILKI